MKGINNKLTHSKFIHFSGLQNLECLYIDGFCQKITDISKGLKYC